MYPMSIMTPKMIAPQKTSRFLKIGKHFSRKFAEKSDKIKRILRSHTINISEYMAVTGHWQDNCKWNRITQGHVKINVNQINFYSSLIAHPPHKLLKMPACVLYTMCAADHGLSCDTGTVTVYSTYLVISSLRISGSIG
jgi:hypothetical protein